MIPATHVLAWLPTSLRSIAAVAAVFTVAVLFSWPYTVRWNQVAVEESYLQFSSYVDLNLLHLWRDGALPWWTFHFGGGYPFIKHPDNPVFSPLFLLFFVPFGTAAGTKLLVLTAYAAGALGFFLVCRRMLGYQLLASAIGTLLFVLNGFIPWQISTGNIKDVSWMYVPLLLYLTHESVHSPRVMALAAAMVAFLLLNGFSLYMAPLGLFLGLLALLVDLKQWPTEKRRLQLIRCVCIALVVGAGLAAIRLVPVLSLLQLNDRTITDYDAAAGGALGYRGWFHALLLNDPYRYQPLSGFAMYVGPFWCGLFAVSAVVCFKRVWQYVMVLGLFAVLCMAHNAPVDLFYPLWHLPIFRSVHEPARYFGFPIVLLFPLIACALLSDQRFTGLPSKVRGVVYVAVSLGLLDVFATNAAYYTYTAQQMEDVAAWQMDEEFFNVRLPLDSDRENGIQYFLLRQNVGLIDWYGNIELPEAAVPRYALAASPDGRWRDLRVGRSNEQMLTPVGGYRGEAYLEAAGQNRVTDVQWRTNEIRVEIKPGESGTLVVNQSYDSDWTSSVGPVVSHHGLLAVAVNSATAMQVTLRYRPHSLYVGAGLSLLSLAIAGAVFWRKPQSPEMRSSECV